MNANNATIPSDPSTLAAAKREAMRLFDLLPVTAQRQALAEFRAYMAGKGAA